MNQDTFTDSTGIYLVSRRVGILLPKPIRSVEQGLAEKIVMAWKVNGDDPTVAVRFKYRSDFPFINLLAQPRDFFPGNNRLKL
ncbi:MAG: hypothetical protein ACREEM_16000 [Blastocatellia bacterium]